MSILDYFHTTNKGIVPMSELPKESYLSKTFFTYSVTLEIMIMLIFIGLFAQAILRSVKKIKNPDFKIEEEEIEEQNEERDDKDTNSNLIYRFNEEDHEKKNELDGEDKAEKIEKMEAMEENSEEDYNKEHDEDEDRFLEIDTQILLFQPFLVGHILCINSFSSNYISIIALVASGVLFSVFNIKGLCSNMKLLSMTFTIPAMLSFLPFFVLDHEMST